MKTQTGNAKTQRRHYQVHFFLGLEMCEKRRPSVRPCLSFAKVVCSSNFIYANISHSLLKYLSHLINTNLGTVMRYWARMLAINSKEVCQKCGKGSPNNSVIQKCRNNSYSITGKIAVGSKWQTAKRISVCWWQSKNPAN